MVRFVRLMAGLLFFVAAWSGGAHAEAYKLQCYSQGLTPPVSISGAFERPSGVGHVRVGIPGREDSIFSDVTFYQGVWTAGRLTFHLPSPEGAQVAFVLIDDYFTVHPLGGRVVAGVMGGEFGDADLTCFNSTCDECMQDPRPTSPYCRDVCRCTSPFCGSW